MNNTFLVQFNEVQWPNGFEGPKHLEKTIRDEFLKDREGNIFSNEDLSCILNSYLQDEFGECPTSLKFSMMQGKAT